MSDWKAEMPVIIYFAINDAIVNKKTNKERDTIGQAINKE